ncbi:glutamine amidotransferase [Devosia sp.]|uniref:glutamine amidotransferase n=1 Tax=Devosia sp. TaxID=1871048 RepID=UPI003A9277EA
MTKPRVLIAGESWTVHSIHQKGFDSFTTTEYAEGVHWLREALIAGGWEVTYQPAHVAVREFPFSAEELGEYDCVIISDIGANSLQLHPDTFSKSVPKPDRLEVIADYVRAGGGLIMVGGYLTFQGIDAKARYAGTPVEDVLPVTLLTADDRVERPNGTAPEVVAAGHPIAKGLDGAWPDLLGYNRVMARPEAVLVASVGADPLIVAGESDKGRSVAFTSDCGPHWAPPPFVEWDGYARLWAQMADWAAGRI